MCSAQFEMNNKFPNLNNVSTFADRMITSSSHPPREVVTSEVARRQPWATAAETSSDDDETLSTHLSEQVRSKEKFAMNCIEELRAALEKSVLENEEMARDMERLIDTLERTHEEKRRCEEENYELQMENEQLAKQNTLLTTRLKYDRKEEEWKAEKEHLMAQLKVCQQALEAYMTPYKRHSRKKKSSSSRHHAPPEEDSCITNAESALTRSSSLVRSILSLDQSKTSLNKELRKSSRNRQRDSFFLDTPSTNNSIAGLESTLSRLSVLDQASHSTSKVSTNADQASHLQNRKSSRSRQRDALNVSNHSSSRTANLDFGLAKLDELSGAKVRTKRYTEENLSATSSTLQRLYEASRASSDADTSATNRSRPSWSLDLSMLDSQDHTEQEQPTESNPRRRSSKGHRRPSGNEPSQDKESLNRLVQQAKLSLFL